MSGRTQPGFQENGAAKPFPCEAVPPGRKYRCARMATEEIDEMLLCWQHAKIVRDGGPGSIDTEVVLYA